jgi:hypothetical protein
MVINTDITKECSRMHNRQLGTTCMLTLKIVCLEITC